MPFHHGTIYTTEVLARPATNVSSTAIVLLGTAGKGPNVPTLCNSIDDVIKKFGAVTNDEFSIPKDAADIFVQASVPLIVINVLPSTTVTSVANENVVFGANGKAKLANGHVSALTTTNAVTAKLRFAPNNTITLPTGITAVTSVKSADGVTTYSNSTDYNVSSNVITNLLANIPAGAEVLVAYTATLAVNTDYTLEAETGILTRTNTSKIAPRATIVASYSKVSAAAITGTNIIGTNSGGTKTGAEQISDIPSTLKIDLGNAILIAPDWTYQLVTGGGYNAVVNKLLTLANTCGTTVVTDTPNTTKEDAVAYAYSNPSDRILAVGLGFIRKTINGQLLTRPSAASVAGLIASTDNLVGGVTLSPSNRLIRGIESLAKPASFNLAVFSQEGVASDTNYLNENGVATIINNNGFRLFGNYSTSQTQDQSRFYCVKRGIDYLGRVISKGSIQFIDAKITAGYIDLVTEYLNDQLLTLKGQEVILNGEAWPASADINTPAELLAGNVYFNIAVSFPSPAQTINILTKVTNGYVTEFTEAAVI